MGTLRIQLHNFTRTAHSRPQSLRSFWPVIVIESSGLVQQRTSAIHRLPVKSSKSDWLTMRNEYSAHAQKIGSGQSSRSQAQARRIMGSGDENAELQCKQTCHKISSDHWSTFDIKKQWPSYSQQIFGVY